MSESRAIEILDMIIKDVEDDAENFDGKPFNGLTVGTQFGYQAAAIGTLARIVKALLLREVNIEETNS